MDIIEDKDGIKSKIVRYIETLKPSGNTTEEFFFDISTHNLDSIVGIRSRLFLLLSFHRPNAPLAAANTLHRLEQYYVIMQLSLIYCDAKKSEKIKEEK